MPTPTKSSILIGLLFVFVGSILVLSDRWPEQLSVQGSKSRKPHTFDHLFLLWFLKQLIQLLLLPLYYLIDKKIWFFGRLQHGQIPINENNNQQMEAVANYHDEQDINTNEDQNQPLLPNGRQAAQRKHRSPSLLIYFPAALFAQASILLMYFGLKLTYSSSFIMLKGTVAFFTALLAMAFLAQQLACYIWFGVIVATLGFAVSGISDYIHPPSGGYEKYGIAAGDLLMVMSQIMFATKIIYEEKFIRKHSIHPMLFLGAEAAYGVVFAGIFLALFNLLDLVQYSYLPNGRIEDVVDAWYQLANSWECALAFSGSLIFYLLYTYLGMFLIRDHGALPRIMIETFIWVIYWTICVLLHWEEFFIAQVPGLCVIPIGALIYSHILVFPCGERHIGAHPNIFEHEQEIPGDGDNVDPHGDERNGEERNGDERNGDGDDDRMLDQHQVQVHNVINRDEEPLLP